MIMGVTALAVRLVIVVALIERSDAAFAVYYVSDVSSVLVFLVECEKRIISHSITLNLS